MLPEPSSVVAPWLYTLYLWAMNNVDMIINAGWVVAVDSRDRVLPRHSLLISNSRIVAILPTEQTAEYASQETVDLPGHALFPGFINTHTHAAMSLLRGIADDLPLQVWLNDHIWPLEAQWISEEFVRAGSRLSIAEMIKTGTTCFNDMYYFPDQTAAVADLAGIRASLGLIMLDFPTIWASDPEEYLAKGLALHDQLQNHARLTTAFAPHAPYTVSDGPLRKLQVLADELDIPVHIHVHETEGEINTALSVHGHRPLDRLHSLGLLTSRAQCVHMTQLLESELELLTKQGCHIVHCPESNMKLASGYCPVSQLLDSGVNVALGTDSAASNNNLNMLAEMRTAALLAKNYAGDPTVLPAHQALQMATINGARALGLEQQIGSLENNKSADIIAVDMNHLQTQPLYDPVSQLVYAADSSQITDVWVAGKHILRDSSLTTMNEKDILEESQHWGKRIQQGKKQQG